MTLTCALVALVAVLLAPQPSAAQARLDAGIGFLGGFPQGDFSDNVDAEGYGLSLHGGYLLPGAPVMIGAELGFLIYGHETRREPFSTTIPDVTVEVTTDNSIFLGHLLLRVQPGTGMIRPYLDGLIGVHYLSTETSIKDEDGGEDVASSTNQDDAAFSAGGGAGVLIRVYDGVGRGVSQGWGVDAVSIDLRGRYLYGGEAEYLKEGSIRRSGGRVTFDVLQSRTDLLTAYLGVAVQF